MSKYMQVIAKQEGRFVSLDKANGSLLDFKQECLFARQQISKNDFTVRIAEKNPESLKSAILNVSAIGVSLNPANQHAYLVPRAGQICLDISFRGLVKLATDSGSIKWAKAELIYKKDTFKYRGPAETPLHEANVFGDRGEMIGGYCIAKLPDGDTLIDVMPVDEIHKIRATSQAFKKGGGPWVDWYEEMCKKTIIKRASKSWPESVRLNQAVTVLNEHEGTAYTIEQHVKFMELFNSGDCVGIHVFLCGLDEDVQTALFNSFEKGHISSGKAKIREMQKSAQDQIDQWGADIIACYDSDDDSSANEILDCEPALQAMIKHSAGLTN